MDTISMRSLWNRLITELSCEPYPYPYRGEIICISYLWGSILFQAESEDKDFIHTEDKPHVCCVCGKQFNRDGTLTVQLRIYSGDMPYQCLVLKAIFL